MPTTPTDDWLTPDQVATWLGMSVDSLSQLRYRGRGPRFSKPTARRVLYRRDDVTDWLNSRVRARTDRGAS